MKFNIWKPHRDLNWMDKFWYVIKIFLSHLLLKIIIYCAGWGQWHSGHKGSQCLTMWTCLCLLHGERLYGGKRPARLQLKGWYHFLMSKELHVLFGYNSDKLPKTSYYFARDSGGRWQLYNYNMMIPWQFVSAWVPMPPPTTCWATAQLAWAQCQLSVNFVSTSIN